MARKTYHVYTWMEDELRRQIVSGLLPESRPIWSESVLMAKYGIGRNAVRTAIGNLEMEGLLKRVHGSGTYVVPRLQRKHQCSNRKKSRTILYLSFPPFSEKTFQINTEIYFQDLIFLLHQGKYELQMAHVGLDGQVPEILQKGNIDGIIFEGEVPTEFYKQYIYAYPHVGIDFINPEFHCSWIESGKFSAGESAVKYLYQRGHRRIAFLTDEYHTWSAVEFLKGYRSAMMEQGLPMCREWEICWMRQTTGGELNNESFFLPRNFLEYLKPVFALSDPPTAIICYDNWRAVSTVEALNKLGLRIPDDISIVGNCIDESPSYPGAPRFACFNIRMRESYLEGYRLLQEKMNNPQFSGEKTVCLNPFFTSGETVRTI
ncbi:MAG: GntR family transcriptional regulator [Lentisphaeria bacterium]|nr:GntR family transcriptional regulator [Lentisphaeria bacterium]